MVLGVVMFDLYRHHERGDAAGGFLIETVVQAGVLANQFQLVVVEGPPGGLVDEAAQFISVEHGGPFGRG
jgi:hypothetical protein